MTRRTLGLLAIIVALVAIAAVLQVVVFLAYENMFVVNFPKWEEWPPPAVSTSCPRFRPAEYSAGSNPRGIVERRNRRRSNINAHPRRRLPLPHRPC